MFPLRQDCTFRVNHPRIRIIPNAETAGKHLASAVAAREKEVDPMPEPEQTTTFPSGAIRSRDADRTRFDLIPPRAWHRLAETCAEGAGCLGMPLKTTWLTPSGTSWPLCTLSMSAPI